MKLDYETPPKPARSSRSARPFVVGVLLGLIALNLIAVSVGIVIVDVWKSEPLGEDEVVPIAASFLLGVGCLAGALQMFRQGRRS